MIYELLSRVYDEVNKDIDYVSWGGFLEKCIDTYSDGTEKELLLDLGCGSGKMTVEMAKRGYDMTGVDNCPEMLDLARERAASAAVADKTLLLCQDMRSFELYGTVGNVISCLDTVNHITKKEDLATVFSLVHNYLVPGGLFLFDVNGKHKFETVYADRSYVYEIDGAVCTWENAYREKSGLCDFYINLFEEDGDGRYERYFDSGKEKMYRLKTLRSLAEAAGFDWIGAWSDFDGKCATDEDDRIYIALKCRKEG